MHVGIDLNEKAVHPLTEASLEAFSGTDWMTFWVSRANDP